MNFRKIESDFSLSIRNSAFLTLILIKSDGSVYYERTRAGKDSLLNMFHPEEDLMLMAWTGMYKTDIFHITAIDLDAHYGNGNGR